MKVLFLTTHPHLPSSRFRVYQYLDYFNKEGINCDVFPVMPINLYDKFYGSNKKLYKFSFNVLEVIYRLRDFLRSNHYDIVFIQKKLLSLDLRLFSMLLNVVRSKIFFDFDDAIYLNPYQRLPAVFGFLEDSCLTDKLIQRSDVILAGNQYLKEYALAYNPNVYVIPTSVDTDYFILKKNSLPSDKVTLVWTGSYGTGKYINILGKVIAALSQKYKLKLLIISNIKRFIDFSCFGKAEVIFKTWNFATEVRDLHLGDIGLAPLDDTEFSRGKCGLKNLMYMSSGIPAISSPVGVNSKIIKDGINGFLADSDEEWIYKLGLLIENQNLRKKLGSEARKTVEEYYSVRANAPKLKSLFEELQ